MPVHNESAPRLDVDSPLGNKIVDAAMRCFDTWGVERTRMGDVALEAEVARPTLYRYFQNKEALVQEVMVRHIRAENALIRKRLKLSGPGRLLSGLLATFPDLKIVLAESQLAWVPYVLSRADFVWKEMRGDNFTDIDTSVMSEPPSFYFDRNIWLTFFRDPVGLTLLEHLGVDNVLYETDFPHSDSSWPTSHDVASEMTSGLAEADARKIVADNARALFRVDIAG